MSDLIFRCRFEVPRHAVKKNSKEIFMNRSTGRRFVSSNSKTIHVMNVLNAKLLTEKLKQRIETIDFDICAEFIFETPRTVFFTKAGTRSHRIPDLSNLFEAPQDALQKVGIIKNDSLICALDGSRRVPIDDTKYFLSIRLFRFVPKKLD